jgi:hypothetical protein
MNFKWCLSQMFLKWPWKHICMLMSLLRSPGDEETVQIEA